MRKTILIALLLCALSVPAWAQDQPVNADGTITSQSTVCQTNTSCVTLMFTPNTATATLQLVGTFSATLAFEITNDGIHWYTWSGSPYAGGALVSSATVEGLWIFPTAGMQGLRVRCSTWSSGSIAVLIQSSTGPFSTGSASTQDVNLVSVGGDAFQLGQGTSAESLSIVPASDLLIGQQTSALSAPVVIASDQTTIATSRPITTVVTTSGLGAVVYTAVGSSTAFEQMFCSNPSTSQNVWIQAFDSASVSLGSTSPKEQWMVPFGGGLSLGANELHHYYTNSIKIAATTLPSGSVAPSSTITCNVGYIP